MSSGDVRKGATQAKLNSDLIGLFMFQILVVAGLFGLIMSSWWVFGGVLIGLMVGIYIPYINLALVICLSAAWVLAGAEIVNFFQGGDVVRDFDPFDIDSALVYLKSLFPTPATIVVGGLLGLAGLGTNISAIEWSRDIAED